MKVIVINLKKFKRFLFAFLSLLVILSLTIPFLHIHVESEPSSEYVDAMQRLNEENTIIIDAGHGGEDPGAVGVNGRYEKDLNLELSILIGEGLKEEGYAVIYTRCEDKLLYTEEENIYGIRKISDLKNRCKIAAEYPFATFVSIHMNSYGNPKYSGLQVYYGTQSEGSLRLAATIQDTVKSTLQPGNNRVIKAGRNMYLMENISGECVLIECGFLTNPEECEKLSKKEYQKELSLAIVCGIIEYKENTN